MSAKFNGHRSLKWLFRSNPDLEKYFSLQRLELLVYGDDLKNHGQNEPRLLWYGEGPASFTRNTSVTVDGGGCLDLRCQAVASQVDVDGEVEENEAGSAVATSA